MSMLVFFMRIFSLIFSSSPAWLVHIILFVLLQVKSRLALMSNTNVDFGKLLSSDLIPSQLGKPGPDFIACQKLVALFVNCQKQLGSRIVAHQEEIQSHKDHINTLKKELGAACRREYEDEVCQQTTIFRIAYAKLNIVAYSIYLCISRSVI